MHKITFMHKFTQRLLTDVGDLARDGESVRDSLEEALAEAGLAAPVDYVECWLPTICPYVTSGLGMLNR